MNLSHATTRPWRRQPALLAALLALALLLPRPAAAQHHEPAAGAPILDETQGDYRIVVYLEPRPLLVGEADLTIEVTDAAGKPRTISALNVIISSQEIGLDKLYLAPRDEASGPNIHRSHRLYFSAVGGWNVRIQLLDQATQLEFKTVVSVAPITGRILEAAIITVPAFLALAAIAAVGWRVWRRRQRLRREGASL